MSHPLVPLARQLAQRAVRYTVIGVSGANLYAPASQAVFTTDDIDLFLPSNSDNLVNAWTACDEVGLQLFLGSEPLDRPRDRWLADRIIERRVLTRATGANDLTLHMEGFEFETVWTERRVFSIEDVELPTARLRHIVESTLATGRDKDKLFLATHKEALEQLLKRPDLD